MLMPYGFERGVNVYDVTLDDVRVEDMQGGYLFHIEGIINNLNVNNFSLLGGNIAPPTILSNAHHKSNEFRGPSVNPASRLRF